jgi:hypothetical protein
MMPQYIVIPGQCDLSAEDRRAKAEALNPEPRGNPHNVCPWVPGSTLRVAPE